MLIETKIKEDKQWLLKISDDIKQKSNLCFIVSDTTRIKILFLLKRREELCVTDLSKILGISMSAVSHQLSSLEKACFVKMIKMGKVSCYFLDKKGSDTISLLEQMVDV